MNRRRRSRLGGALLGATTVVGIALGLTAPSVSPVAPATVDTAAVTRLTQPFGRHGGHPGTDGRAGHR